MSLKNDYQSFFIIISFAFSSDVSETNIASLPTAGMDFLRELKARDAWALKKLPPIKSFQHLTSANLTYPSHCCGFKNLIKKRGWAPLSVKHLVIECSQRLRSAGLITNNCDEKNLTEGSCGVGFDFCEWRCCSERECCRFWLWLKQLYDMFTLRSTHCY